MVDGDIPICYTCYIPSLGYIGGGFHVMVKATVITHFPLYDYSALVVRPQFASTVVTRP